MRATFALIGAAALLSGCASLDKPRHTCPLDAAGNVTCNDMETAYKAAQRNGGNRFSVFGDAMPAESTGNEVVAADGRVVFTGYPGAEDRGRPVYQPATVWRLWTAPWTDASGVMHGGEYNYFTTPGHWNYGTLTAPGEGAGVLGPVHPKDLGFNPAPVMPKFDGQASGSSLGGSDPGVVQPYR